MICARCKHPSRGPMTAFCARCGAPLDLDEATRVRPAYTPMSRPVPGPPPEEADLTVKRVHVSLGGGLTSHENPLLDESGLAYLGDVSRHGSPRIKRDGPSRIAVDRLLAFVVDQVAVIVLTAFALFLIFLAGNYFRPTTVATQINVLIVLWIVVEVGYFVFFCGRGRTLGQRVLGLRVVTRDTFRQPGLVRGLLRLVASIVLIAPAGLGMVPVFFSKPRSCGWHDLLAGTEVVRRSAVPVPPPADSRVRGA